MSHNLNGLILSLVSSLAFAVVAWLVAYFNGGLKPAELLFYRSVLTIILIFPWIFSQFKTLSWSSIRLLGLRGFWGGIAILIYFFNISQIGPTLAANLLSFSSVFSLFIGVTLKKEKLTKMQFIGVALCNLGVFFILNQNDEAPVQFVLMGLLGSFFAAWSVNSAKEARQARLSPNLIYFAFSLMTIFAPLPFLDRLPGLPTPDSWLPIVAMVASAWVAQYSLTGAYVSLGNARASALGRLMGVWAFLLEIGFNPKSYTNLKFVVCIFILSGSVLIAVGQRQARHEIAEAQS